MRRPNQSLVVSPAKSPKMEYRKLGNSGLKVSAISLGGWVTYGGTVGEEAAYACMKAAYDIGINFFDTAEAYSGGASEKIMGKAIKKFGWKRNDLVISTKIYWGTAYGEIDINNLGLSRKHIIEGTAQSLDRLGLDYVDLIYAHRPDRDTPMEETVRAFNAVINSGQAFYWGTSEWDADEIAEAWGVADRLGLIGPLMEQPQYNLLVREKVEGQYLHLFETRGMGITSWSPLEQGLLTGRYNDCDKIPEGSRLKDNMSEEEFLAAVKKCRLLAPIAKKLDISQATLALAWVIKNPRVSSAITGASKEEQVYDNLKAIAAMEKLTPDVIKEIDDVLGNKPAEKRRRFG